MIGLDVTATDDVAKFKPGTIFEDIGVDGPVKSYKYVQYNDGAGAVAAVIGQVAYYHLAGGYALEQVTSDESVSVDIGAGVLQSAPTDAQFCWIQRVGPATLSIALTSGGDGNALTAVGAGDGSLAISALVTDAICAYADDASADQIVCCFPR